MRTGVPAQARVNAQARCIEAQPEPGTHTALETQEVVDSETWPLALSGLCVAASPTLYLFFLLFGMC